MYIALKGHAPSAAALKVIKASFLEADSNVQNYSEQVCKVQSKEQFIRINFDMNRKWAYSKLPKNIANAAATSTKAMTKMIQQGVKERKAWEQETLQVNLD